MSREPIRGFALEFDRDYGIDKRTGWTVVVNGRVVHPQLTSLPQALWALWAALVEIWWKGDGDE